MAEAPEYWSCPLRLPTPTAAHVAIASGVSQRVTSPRRTRARSYSARFRPADAVQLTLPWHAPDDRSRVVRLTAAVDAINRRYGRTLIGYGQCGEPGGYVGAAKIAYGRIPELEDFQ